MTHQSSPQLRRFAASITLVFAGCFAGLYAHEGHEHDQQPPYDGPGWSGGGAQGGGGGDPPIEFASSGVQLLAWIPVVQFDSQNTSANTCEGYVSASGREYAVLGTSHGTGFVDLADPAQPQIIAFIQGPASLWRDVQVYQHYVYAVSEGGGGIQIMSLAQIDAGIVTLIGAVNSPEPSSTHTQFINQQSGYLYRCGGGPTKGVRMYSLANPAIPSFIATALPDRYVHECQVVNYDAGKYAGREILFCYSDNSSSGSGGGAAVDILDVTDKFNVAHMSQVTWPNARFSHQGWLSPDRKFIYVDDELDEQFYGLPTLTRVINVEDLNDPYFVGGFGNGGRCIDHNLYTLDNLIFESNYRSGLRIFDATDPIAPVEVGFFDTYPPDDNPNFNSLWDNYPYLPSGIVLGSDIEKGLFVWRVAARQLDYQFPDGRPALLNPRGDSLTLEIHNAAGALLPESAKLHIDSGQGFSEIALQHQGGNAFIANFPALPCGSIVRYYFSAQATNGMSVRSPLAAPAQTHDAVVASASSVGFQDDMEADSGWTVGAPGDDAVRGIWQRAQPNATTAQPGYCPSSANCWLTENGVAEGSLGDADVDGGSTSLTSPLFDATQGANPHMVYSRWYSNNMGGAPDTDSMPVLLSNNNGLSWIELELVSDNANAWVTKRFRIVDFVQPTNQMRLRFVARDLAPGSIVEAGVDDVRIEYFECTPPTQSGDLNSDGVVNVDDLLILLASWGTCPKGDACAADISPQPQGDGLVNVDDLLLLLANWSM